MPLETNFQPDDQIKVELGLPQLPVTAEAEHISMFEESWNQIAYLHENVFLFDSADAAREVAWMVRGEWDECNAVQVEAPDVAAINFVVEQLEAEYCRSGNCCRINNQLHRHKTFILCAQTGSGKSNVLTEWILEAMIGNLESSNDAPHFIDCDYL